MNYWEKLRDPRWQRKRLEVMQRDDFACQCCFGSEQTLNVHHRAYIKGNDPWDYPLASLITLCESCHQEETAAMGRALHDFLIAVWPVPFPNSDSSRLALLGECIKLGTGGHQVHAWDEEAFYGAIGFVAHLFVTGDLRPTELAKAFVDKFPLTDQLKRSIELSTG